jgi:hypothetical protein
MPDGSGRGVAGLATDDDPDRHAVDGPKLENERQSVSNRIQQWHDSTSRFYRVRRECYDRRRRIGCRSHLRRERDPESAGAS